jgi:uncharacterized membrane protein YciS (DUF1049 family)
MIQYSFGLFHISNLVAAVAFLSLTIGVLLQTVGFFKNQQSNGEVV